MNADKKKRTKLIVLFVLKHFILLINETFKYILNTSNVSNQLNILIFNISIRLTLLIKICFIDLIIILVFNYGKFFS